MIGLEARNFTILIEQVLVFQHSLVQASIELHCLNLFLFTTFYLTVCDAGLYKARFQGL